MLRLRDDFADYSLLNNMSMVMVNDVKLEVADHSNRMSKMAKAWGRFMKFNHEHIKQLELAAKYHDIGKLAIPREILYKTSKLDEIEWQIIRSHSSIGYFLADNIKVLKGVAVDILHHHERWDGKGYLAQLSGDEIPKGSRIIAILDAYDAMISERSYKKAMSSHVALSEIQKCAGTQFDPILAENFVEFILGMGNK